MKSFLSLLIFSLFALSMAAQTTIGTYRVDLRAEPDIVPVGRAKLLLLISSSTGQPVTGATVKVIVKMPGMAMGERTEIAEPIGQPGEYVAPAVFAMQGGYDAQISISGSQGTSEGKIQLVTGASSQVIQGISAIEIVIYVLVVVVLLGVLRAIGAANLRKATVPLLVLTAAIIAAFWSVNHFRRPGSMTPLEAQVMDMNAPAPEGKLPVELISVANEAIAPTITANGQVVGYVEQAVNARVAGAIIWMPGYVGDRVTKGQVIARLDTSLLDPMVAEKQAQAIGASKGITMAQSDYQRALADVTQAKSEEAIRVAAVEETSSMAQASQQEKLVADAGIKADEAAVRDARSQAQAAKADRYYWTQELERSKTLFAKGALSRDEYQKAQAMAQSAFEKANQTQAGVDAANAKLQGSRAMASKARLEADAAQSRLNSMKAEHHAHMAHVQSALSAAQSAKARIEQASSEAVMARAGLAGIQAQRNYSEIRAETDGVITDRLISPGVVVAPGQTILKVAQVQPIRVQANVTEADLAVIAVGAEMVVRLSSDPSHPIQLKVTSKSPSVDPSTRLGVVEALYTNPNGRLSPGQFISVQIAVGSRVPQMSVLLSAVQTREKQSIVFVAQPNSSGDFTLVRTVVTLGNRSRDQVEVVAGLKLGDRVVDRPSPDLESGMIVTSTATVVPAIGINLLDQTIQITSAGYSPQEIQAPIGKPFKLTFIRRDAQSCGTKVIFKDLGIQRDLPLNQRVTIDLPALKPGQQLNFTCPMNMLNGKAVAQ